MSSVKRNLNLNLAEGDVLLGPEVLVPVLGFLPQVSQPFLQLWFILAYVVHNRPQVGKRVRWTNPVMCGVGCWSEGRSLHINKNKKKKKSFIALLFIIKYYGKILSILSIKSYTCTLIDRWSTKTPQQKSHLYWWHKISAVCIGPALKSLHDHHLSTVPLRDQLPAA